MAKDKSQKGYKGSSADISAYQQTLAGYNEDSGEFNPYDIIDQSMYKNTARGRMAYQEDLAKLLYLAQINQENRMNEYNSPSEQVKRMREAGINPDLNGVENTPATNVAGYQGNPMDGTQTTMQNVSDVFGIISSVTNLVSGLMTNVSSIFSPSNVLGIADSAVNLFRSANSSGDVQAFINSSPLSGRMKKRLSRFYDSYMSSKRGYSDSIDVDSGVFNAESSYMQSKGNYHSYKNNPLYEQGFFNSSEEERMAYAKVWQPIIDAQNKFLLKELNSKFSKAEYEAARFNGSLGASENDNLRLQNELFKYLKGPIQETIEDLNKLGDKYDWATYVKGVLATVMLQFLKF